jgi:biogenesis of lysosome-related organelles complex 1 subunit KXD1
MAHYTTAYYQTSSLPMAMPTKSPHYYQPSVRGPYAVSPPEVAESVTTGSGMNSGYSATSSSYAGSASGEYDSTSSANNVDLHDYMQDRFATAFDPLPLDRSLATQAQTWVVLPKIPENAVIAKAPTAARIQNWLICRSGKLNAKQREIQELQAKTQARLARAKSRFAEGMQDAKEVKRDLEWTSKRVS